MALRIRFAYTPGFSLAYSIERLTDGLYYDFADATFKATPATLVNPLAGATGNLSGLYRDTIAATPTSQFSDGEYSIHLHNTAAANMVIGIMGATMANGDSSPANSGADPWATRLPGSYAAGTAGAILGTNLDAAVSSRLAAASYAAAPTVGQVVGGVWEELKAGHSTPGSFGALLDAAVSSRSTYAGGPVAGVTAPVTVGTNNDKAGYALSAAEHAGISAERAASLTAQGYTSARAARLDALDVSVSSRLAAASYAAAPTVGQVVGGVWEELKAGHSTPGSFGALLDAAVSSRSTYAGGPVAAVTAPVTVGTNNDKAGYSLGAAGLDSIAVEAGVNARQALSPILAAVAGSLSGAGTGTVVIKGGNVATTRITATTDNAGNRTTVSLTLPA